MDYHVPEPVELTDDEKKWHRCILSTPNRGADWLPIADSMESLFKSLLGRNAIPEIRLRLFVDPAFAETRAKAPKQVFESNGIRGDDIYRHPHFVKYLGYFIHGPDLPNAVITGFCKILNDDEGTSGMMPDQLRRYVRLCVRKHKLDRHSAASEFYRLAAELEIDYDAHSIRTAAMSTRQTRSNE